MFDCIGIEAADDVVQHDTRVNARAEFRMMVGDERGGHHAAVIVIFGDHRCETRCGQLPGKFEMVNGPRGDGGARVHVRVDRPNED